MRSERSTTPLPTSIQGATQSWRQKEPEERRHGYRSVDTMLLHYFALKTANGTPRSLHLDPKTIMIKDGNRGHDRALVAMADLTLCIHRAKVPKSGWRVLNGIYRSRSSHCKRCKYHGTLEGRCCPRCAAIRSEGWTFESLPTLDVLAAEISADTHKRWTKHRVRTVRDDAYERIEKEMRRMGLLVE